MYINYMSSIINQSVDLYISLYHKSTSKNLHRINNIVDVDVCVIIFREIAMVNKLTHVN